MRISNFQGAKVFSVLDLNSEYYQIPLSSKSRKTTAFCTPIGLYEFTKLPVENSVGCPVLSRVVDSLFGDLKHKYVYNFMDNLVVYSKSMEEHLIPFAEVFGRIQKAGFNLNQEKVNVARAEIKCLGHYLSEKGIEILPESIEAIVQFPPPKNLKAVRRSMGMVGFYGSFVKRKKAIFRWEEPRRQAFQRL
jgi:hypothetical protein